ncbi:TetR family transcriptional regulator [Streptomyces sp. NPDC001833]|uniref:TetR family transcriptional regulator n=1 Tax=Streptomyces sp. NPDC001833 TaxID=3154658 RepID=UPI003333AD66
MRRAGHTARERLLTATKEEFAQFGVVGLRIKRIASAAQASKDRLYAYFPSSRDLFAEVMRRRAAVAYAAAAPAADDMAGRVGRLSDLFSADPSGARVSA